VTEADLERAVVDAAPRRLFIGGEWRDARKGRTFPVMDPATGEVLTRVADADAVDGVAALAAAADAQEAWAATPPRARAEMLRAVYEAMTDATDRVALLVTLEMGKPLAESRAEVAYAAEFFRWFSEEAVRTDGRFAPDPSGRGRLLVMRQPVGPALLITPWNFPMAMPARKLAAALAAGCTTVVKPAELTPLSTLALARLLAEADVPAGAVNVVATSDPARVVDAVMGDVRLRKVSFTGSTPVGKRLMAAAASNVARVSLELGGNAPFLVFADADVEAAVEGAVIAKMRNIGEACTAANRFLVHESIAEEFAERLANRLGTMKVGRGTDPGVEVGPLIDGEARAKVAGLVDDARARGARILVGGDAPEGAGWFYEPTVLDDVPPDARLLHEEIFGPVAPISAFSTEEEAVAAANHTDYGLVAYAYTGSLDRALRLAERLDTGMVGLNRGAVSNAAAPFGGVKLSGFGREGGHEGLDEYLSVKYVALP